MRAPKSEAPGLRWHDKRTRPIWHARADAVKAGYRPKSVDLIHIAEDPAMIRARCEVLQADQALWMLSYRRTNQPFDGSVASLLAVYESHPESTFHRLRPGTAEVYSTYIGTLRAMIGERLVAEITGLDLMRWSEDWSSGGRYLAKAKMMRTTLLAAAAFGTALSLDGARHLSATIRETQRSFPSAKPRTQTLSAHDVEALRKAAHDAEAPARALAYAIIFETTLRLWDVIGQWWPCSRMQSDVVSDDGKAWAGLRWEDIDDDLVLRFEPSKTSGTTGARIAFPLTSAPMVVDELRNWPAKFRAGPIILAPSGLPYNADAFQRGFRADRKAAGLSGDIWARDLRASGISEARAAGVLLDDAAKVAGHSSTKTTGDVYDRALMEAAERFAKARTEQRAVQKTRSSGKE